MKTSGVVQVLIVDDQEAFRQAARLVVELTDGFEVAGEAEDGASALARAGELRPDLVLMDINMPGMDGLEATRRLLAEVDGVQVVVLSTYEPAEYAPRALAAGAIAYLPKAVLDPESLAAAWLAGTPA